MPRADIPALYQDRALVEAMTLYARCRRFGGEQIQWPFDPSWANNPAIIVDVIDAILQEEAALRASAFEDTD